MWPKKVLMVKPDYFDVVYQINPHMTDSQGQLKKVNKSLALTQWYELKEAFEALDLKVEVLDGKPGFPDMVFCANQTFPFINENAGAAFILSSMASPYRAGEVEFFKKWAQENEVKYVAAKASIFEGMGDALWDYSNKKIFAGHGFRTQESVYEQVRDLTKCEVISLELHDERFYHLDTCLAILAGGLAAYVPSAFTPAAKKTLEQSFKRLIEVPLNEAVDSLACNMCAVNQNDIIIEKTATKTIELLTEEGFRVHGVDTSEFLKSGGSVFCMKQFLHF